MKRLLVLALVVSVAGCTDDIKAKREAEAAAKKKRAEEAMANMPKPQPPEESHILVKAGPGTTSKQKGLEVLIVKVGRDGTIDSRTVHYNSAMMYLSEAKGGAATAQSCCSAGAPAEIRAMGGAMGIVSSNAKVKPGDSCDEPVMLDGDYKAPWGKVQKVLSVMAGMNMTRLVVGTRIEKEWLEGVVAKLPPGWNVKEAVPATAKVVEISVSGPTLQFAVDGKKYSDVGPAATDLAASGTKSVALHPMDARTPLWAVERGIELANSVNPSGPVWFVLDSPDN